MKNSIVVTALFLLTATGLFAATPVKTLTADGGAGAPPVTFSSMTADRGIDVKLQEGAADKSVVMIYDQDNNVLFKDVLSSKTSLEKGYVLTKLETGDYVMEVTTNNQVVKKYIHVYNEDNKKTFIILEQ